MPDLITLQDAYDHLRLDYDTNGSDDDGWLSVFIPAISEAVALWLKDSWRLYVPEVGTDGAVVVDSDGDPLPLLDSDGAPVVRPVVRGACLIELERRYRFRGGEGGADVPVDAGYGYTLGKGATSLLSTIRKSTVA